MQQMFLGLGAGAKKTYVDDIFSTFLRKSTGATATVVNGINLSGEGGLVWTKSRSNTFQHVINDSIRGANHILASNTDTGSVSGYAGSNTFTSTGYSIAGGDATNNASGYTYVDWSFRKAPGFFDVVSWTGNNASNRAISHSLGSAPGLILVKCTSTTKEWQVWHRDQHGKVGVLDTTAAFFSNASRFPTTPTSTNFYIGNDSALNDGSSTYVAYVFAGGESTAATARSVVFDNDGDRINIGDASNKSSDLNFGSSDFTWECWIKADATQSSYPRIIHNNTSNTAWGSNASMIIWDHNSQSNRISFFVYNQDSGGSNPLVKSAVKGWNGDGQWHHVAVTRSGNIFRLFSDGVLEDTLTWTGSLDNGNAYMGIGQRPDGTSASESFKGSISNVRIVKGTAVYTSSFRPSTQPLTNITNTKLLCCNNSSVTGSTVTPLTISANDSPTASSDSPFDDPAGFVFADAEDQNVIKCGSYTGNGSTDGPEVYLGFEPSWVMVKNTAAVGLWLIADNIRGAVTGGDDPYLSASSSNAEYTSYNWIEFTPTGFKLTNSGVSLNASGNKYVYLCIRRPDGYVGKPPELGTDVFAMDTGNGSNTIPAFDSGFPVDFGIKKAPASTGDWITSTRLTGLKVLRTNTTAAEGTSTTFVYDSNVGYAKSQDSTDQGWMWKRHAGFDVVCYEGTQTVQDIKHSLNKAPEMMWIKNRDNSTYNWSVYHSGLGDNRFKLYLNTNQDYTNDAAAWNNTAPTSTHFTLGIDATANKSGDSFIAMLFSSISGISSMGAYTGNGQTGSSGPFITTGFSPRFIIVKRTDTAAGYGWNVHDTTRGIDDRLRIQTDAAENTLAAFDLSSTGFRVKTNNASYNTSSGKYVYYAHA